MRRIPENASRDIGKWDREGKVVNKRCVKGVTTVGNWSLILLRNSGGQGR